MLPRFLQRPSVLSSVLLLCAAMHVRDDRSDGPAARSRAAFAPTTPVRAAGR